jgi:hypothetical protein
MRAKLKTGCRLFCICAVLYRTCWAQDALEIQLKSASKPASLSQSRRPNAATRSANEFYGWKVRYVKIESLWAHGVQLPLKAGDLLTSENLAAAKGALREAIHKDASSNYGLESRGEVAVLFITEDFDASEAAGPSNDSTPPIHSVGVTFRIYYVHLSLVQIGDKTIPIPQTPYPTSYDVMPRPLRAFHPVIGLSHDRAFGTAFSGAFDTDLLTLAAAADGNAHFEIRGQGMKSLEEAFYRADIGFRYGVRQKTGLVQELAVTADFDGVDEPFGDGEHERNAGSGALAAKLKLAPNTRLWLDAGYRRTDDRVSNGIGDPKTSANEQTGRLLLEAIPPSINGFVRAAVWQEAGWQTGSGGAYQRLAGRVGYAKEFSVAPNQAIGIEIITGAGKTIGDSPSYANFFGGNSDSQFLYDRAAAAALTKMTSGPIIRSFGENEAGLRDRQGRVVGAETFWHVNLNVAVPIPFLSRSLVPDEPADLDDENGNPMSIKQVLINQVDNSGPSFLIDPLKKKEGLSDKEATERAKEIIQEISPAAHYIINDANLYSIKPLVMFDAAGMSGHNASSETWLAAGAGIQLTVVTAKVEVGYMQTLSGPTFGSDHNIFARLVFQNLF